MPRKYAILFLITAGVILLDQWSKYAIVRDLTRRFEGLDTFSERLSAMYSTPPAIGGDGLHFRAKRWVNVSESFLRLRYAENPGAAWGLFRNLPENVRAPLFHVVSIGAVVLITYYFTRLTGAKSERWALYGLPLVLGGAIGNYIDRLARSFVVDFIEAHWMDRASWPSFNIADSAICIGVAMLVIDAFVRRDRRG